MQMLTLLSRERSERGRGAGGEADGKVRWYLNSNKCFLWNMYFSDSIIL